LKAGRREKEGEEIKTEKREGRRYREKRKENGKTETLFLYEGDEPC